MKTLGATATAAIAANAYRVAWAVEITCTDATVKRYTDWADGATISAQSYTAKPLDITLPSYGPEIVSNSTVRIGDASGDLTAKVRDKTLSGGTVTLYELLASGSDSFEAVLLLTDGLIEGVRTERYWTTLKVATASALLWAQLIPDQVGPKCRYRDATQCAFVATCDRTYTTCTSNAQTAIFGGFRFILPAGSRIEWHDGYVTIGGGEGKIGA